MALEGVRQERSLAFLAKHEESGMTQAPVQRRGSESPFGAREECVGYGVFDPLGQKIGSVEKLFFNGNGELEYVRTRIGGLFTKRILIPVRNAALDRETKSLTLK